MVVAGTSGTAVRTVERNRKCRTESKYLVLGTLHQDLATGFAHFIRSKFEGFGSSFVKNLFRSGQTGTLLFALSFATFLLLLFSSALFVVVNRTVLASLSTGYCSVEWFY